MAKRTVLYSSAGKKLYAVRDSEGKFKDIQSYARAHAADLRKTATASDAGGATASAAKKKAKKTAKKKATKKAAKKAAKKTAKKAAKSSSRK